ncbi:hypothetical protein [Bacillus sp. T33-2]|uniref:hypothetical protein n=1 Tax=Bacillus sp. T33-2 TaxID=2054168 RepID=UPI002155DFA1|nr:hypothetical protein [Bacillus sp. T33-2]
MNNILYDNAFNLNEWFTVILIIIGFLGVALTITKLPLLISLFNLLFGLVAGLMFDHTIGIEPFDLYDVGDQAYYQYFDVISYLM